MNKIKTMLKGKISFGIKIVPFLAIAILVGVTAVYAGSINPIGIPGKTMKSLTDLNTLINTGADPIAFTTFNTPNIVDPAGTMFSIGDTYDLLKTNITAITTAKANILTGTSLFGIGGTMVDKSFAGNITPTSSDILIPAGYYDGITAKVTAVVPTETITWATADATQYKCEDLTADATQPIDLETVCGLQSSDGCVWNTDATPFCDGNNIPIVPAGDYMTWYAAKAACTNYTEVDQPVGTVWSLPAPYELQKLFVDNNGTPAIFQSYGNWAYWSAITLPAGLDFAYNSYMDFGEVSYSNKYFPSSHARCAH